MEELEIILEQGWMVIKNEVVIFLEEITQTDIDETGKRQEVGPNKETLLFIQVKGENKFEKTQKVLENPHPILRNRFECFGTYQTGKGGARAGN